jgi:glutamate-1-semialdehyde aminotransferase/spore coat polysaccharide biosynthesis protein SpsF (cytidylyltransferase family)
MTAVAIIQARMASTRLPGKVLADLDGIPVLGWVARAAAAIPGIDRVVVATSSNRADDPVARWCEDSRIRCVRGSESDVLGRYAEAARAENASVVMRLTADCPLLDPHVCGQVVTLLHRAGADFASCSDPATWPDGLDCEVFTSAALEAAAREAIRPGDREHITRFIRAHHRRFRIESLICPVPGLWHERWTLDTAADLEFLRAVAAILPKGRPPAFTEVLAALDRAPELRKINEREGANPGAITARAIDKPAAPPSFAESNAFYRRASRTIPLGTQTFSKARMQYPQDSAPLFLTHGSGGRVWDVDGNEYVDMICGLLPVVLGYRDPDVDGAIRRQLARGISFSLATTLEAELAERLVEIIPCAEMVRFGKNGTDATSACIRLARAFTGRNRVIACGYHGWQDWYIGATTRSKGVPPAVRDLTTIVPYDDLSTVARKMDEAPDDTAAVIVEPMTAVPPKEGYLAALKELAHSRGALLVFDEVITGFRFALGGAQSLFGVTPDLAAFGKGLGNGMPISAVVGRADIMSEMEEVFFSGTFGGEALSLAAAIAVIDKMRKEPVIETLARTGETLATGVRERIAKNGLDGVLSINGHPSWKLLRFTDQPQARKEAIRTLFIREMLRNGVLILGSHNICYAHGTNEVAHVLSAYDQALATIAKALASGNVDQVLGIPPIEPIFRVR